MYPSRSKVYQAWYHMTRRCTASSNHNYKRYGGRGIRVCDRWLGSDGFKNFLADIGEPPSRELSIDRIDNNGDYEPGNVRWATSRTQSRNRRPNIVVTYNGETMVLIDWARRVGIPYPTLVRRFRYGMRPETGLFSAPRRYVRKKGAATCDTRP